MMKTLLATAIATTCAAGCEVVTKVSSSGSDSDAVASSGAEQISFLSLDNKKVYADLYSDHKPETKKCVLMFHQAGSNAGEYETIAPKVKALGFDCIAVDQRSGGEMWGRPNRTVDKSGSGEYIDAYNDLVGAMKYAQANRTRQS